MSTRHAVVDTALGRLTLVADGDAVSGVYFAHHWYRPADQSFGPRVSDAEDALLGAARCQLVEYLAGERTAFDLPLSDTGDDFDRSVWALIEEVPYGHTTTYGDLAAALGDRRRAYDVGQSVGRNPLCVIVPCHRVVGSDGSLTGYAGGLRRKRQLLELEASRRKAAS
jgi:methylated-DNA-[protein]-cysteine S-methyltransferase